MAILGRYLTPQETEFAEKRRKALETKRPQDLADSPFLFAHRFIVTEMMVRVKLFEMISDTSGAIIECGVANGNNLMLFSHLSSIVEPYAINRRIVGFDSFAGFRSISSQNDPSDITHDDFSDVSLQNLQEAISLYDSNRVVGHMRRTEIVEGDAVNTIPEYVAQHGELTVALLYLDFDLYEPTKIALEHMLPLVCKGGVVAFDEFNYDKFAGETQAFKEVVGASACRLKRFNFAPFVSYFTVE